MSLYENFIRDLLKNDLVKDYSAKKQSVRKFFEANYRQKAQCSFHKFCGRLWTRWYVIELEKNVIYFDERWMDYINNAKPVQEPLEKKISSEENVCDNKSCQLCLLKFSNVKDYQEHCKCEKHKVRILYVNNIEKFEQNELIKFELVGASNTNGHNTPAKLKFERKVQASAVIKATNTAETNIEVIEVVHVNSYLKELEVKKFEKKTIFKSRENFSILIKGYFENSASFALPIVVVCRIDKEKEKKYFLKEIAVEVSSEFSSLKTGIPYRKLDKVILPRRYDEIIPGEMPTYASNYKETYPLRQYHIPMELQARLRYLTKRYPMFIEKYAPKEADNLYNTFATILNLNPTLTDEKNYYNLLDALISIEENQIMVDIRDYDTMSQLTFIAGNTYDLEVPGLAEARPSLIVHDAVYVKEDVQDCQKFQGIVCSVFEKSVRLSFNRKFKTIYDKKKAYHIEFGYNRRALKVQKQALFLAREHNIIPYFYPKGDQGDIKETVEKITYFNPNLNEEQRRAVVNILKKRSAPYLIFGPPGTGKTVTIVESVLQVWKNQPQARILVCAPSNSATNEIAIRLAKELPNTDLFRLVGYMYGKDRALTQIQGIVNINKDGSFYMPSMEKLLKYRILLTTLVTAARLVNGGTPDNHYSYVFIDEGGYATESESLIPIAGILSNSTNRGKVVGQIVLAGDPRQLGPVVHSNFVKFCGYGTSMLERLIDTCKIYARDESCVIPYNEKYVTKLLRNYRSHKEILNVPNKLFYHNELIPVGSASSDMFTDWEHLMTPGFPVIFHHIVGEDSREYNSPSFFNIQEIEEVMGYARKLVGSRVKGNKINHEDIGIITPYKKQAQMLHKACEKEGWNDLLVGSVEQFQGKERMIIIISTVRSKNVNKFKEIDKKCQLGFVSNAKRFNVAITRAKALLIVIGNGDVLKTDERWRHFIEFCVNNKSVKGKQFHLDNNEYLEENDNEE